MTSQMNLLKTPKLTNMPIRGKLIIMVIIFRDLNTAQLENGSGGFFKPRYSSLTSIRINYLLKDRIWSKVQVAEPHKGTVYLEDV